MATQAIDATIFASTHPDIAKRTSVSGLIFSVAMLLLVQSLIYDCASYDSSFSGDYIETWMQRLEFNPIEVNNYKAGKFVDWMDLVYQNGLRQD